MSFLQLVFSLDKTFEGNNSILENMSTLTDIATEIVGGKSCGKCLKENLVGNSWGKILWEICVGKSCWKSCGKILQENLVGNLVEKSCRKSFGKILWEFLAGNLLRKSD